MTHALKTWPEYYKMVETGKKPFELRKDDRPYAMGDTLVLQEYDPEKSLYTGKESTFIVSYVLRNAEKFGLRKGYCILGLQDKPDYA